MRRWSQGLIFHQATVDWTRAALLVPLALSHHYCRPVEQCSIYETVFLLLATVSAVNLLTTVLNDTPLMPDDDGVDFEWLVTSTESAHWQLVQQQHQQRNKVLHQQLIRINLELCSPSPLTGAQPGGTQESNKSKRNSVTLTVCRFYRSVDWAA